jgi:hypothetical protein
MPITFAQTWPITFWYSHTQLLHFSLEMHVLKHIIISLGTLLSPCSISIYTNKYSKCVITRSQHAVWYRQHPLDTNGQTSAKNSTILTLIAIFPSPFSHSVQLVIHPATNVTQCHKITIRNQLQEVTIRVYWQVVYRTTTLPLHKGWTASEPFAKSEICDIK